MGGLTTKSNVAMFLVIVLMNQMAVSEKMVNSLQSNDVSERIELTVHSSFKEEEILNKLQAKRAPVMTKVLLEGTTQGECEDASQTLWNMYKESAAKVFEIDFVQDLRNGLLCKGSDKYFRYKFFIAQDAFYARAAAVASYFMEFHEANTTIRSLMQKSRVKNEKYVEPLFSRIQDWRAAGWTEPSPVQAAIDYASFDLGVAMNTTNAANILATKAICVKLYRYIANTIAREWQCRSYSHPYKEWIDENVSPRLDDSYAGTTERLFDLAASGLSASECQQLQYYYGEGLRHEFEFFKAMEKCPDDGNYGKHRQSAQY